MPGTASPNMDMDSGLIQMILATKSATEAREFALKLLASCDGEPCDASQSSEPHFPTQAAARLRLRAPTPATTSEYLNQLSNQNDDSAPQMVTARVPRLDSHLRLDGTGNFVIATKQHSQAEIGRNSSQQLEEAVMDKRQRVTYVEVTSREKREVYQIDSVRRSMRHLAYAEVLMSSEILELSLRYVQERSESVHHQRGDKPAKRALLRARALFPSRSYARTYYFERVNHPIETRR